MQANLERRLGMQCIFDRLAILLQPVFFWNMHIGRCTGITNHLGSCGRNFEEKRRKIPSESDLR